jgi:histidine triad (HIT) family protein
MDCIFCNIAAGEIPSKKVVETENVFVIEDINPQSPVHLLVIPKKHYKTVLECEDSVLLAELFTVAKEAAKKKNVDESGFRLVVNTNAEGGQMVDHLHVHLLGGRPQSGKMG